MRLCSRHLLVMAFAFASLEAQAQTTAALSTGWNLIGNGSTTSLSVADTTLFGDPNKVTTVWKWVPAGSKWAFYSPSMTTQGLSDYALSKGYDVLATITGGEGFWVNAKTSFSVSLPNASTIPANSFQTRLLPGWNLISIGETKSPNEFNRLLSTTTLTPGTEPINVTSLWTWEGSQSRWYFYSPSLTNSGGLAAYIQNKGYLDFTVAGKNLGPAVGFWVNKPDAATVTTTTGAATTTTTTTTASTTTTGAATTSTSTAATTTTTTTAAATTTTTVATTTSTTLLAPPTNVTVSNSGTQKVGSLTFSSSTKLIVTWAAPSYSVDHYEISAVETIQNTTITAIATASSTSKTLTGLKSATPYSVTVTACTSSTCTAASSSTAVSATTGNEVWQVQGTGNTWNSAQEVISDSNTKAWAFAYGSGAGSGLDGTARLYYDPDFTDPNQKGVKIGYTTSAATTSPSSVSSFTPATGYGLRFKDPQNAAVKNNYQILTSMPVPLSAAMGGKIRLFFEFYYTGFGANPRGIYYIDSQDGYTGLDYNKGSATVCSTDTEFAPGGDCAPTLAMGKGFPGVDSASQFKIGYPTLTDWRWNGDPGTFMVFGVHAELGSCPTDKVGLGYAQWDGSQWVVSNRDGCPKTWEGLMQAPVPLHLGGAKYKMYYGATDPSDTTCTGGNVPGTKKIIYADGAVTGPPTTVEFEDWETVSTQRDITFLWPDGSEMDSCSEKKLDDFVVYMPTLSADYQVMYMANEQLWLAMAVLLNP